MSTNCLVTKLKGAVNNDNLPLFGKVLVKAVAINQSAITSYNNLVKMTIKNPNKFSVDVVGNGGFNTTYATMESDPQTHMEINSPTYEVSLYFSNGNYDIIIGGKYGIEKFAIFGSSTYGVSLFDVDISQFNYSPIEYFECTFCQNKIHGEFKFPVKQMGELNCTSSFFSGDITGVTINNNSNNIGRCLLYGDYSDYISVKAGSTQGTCFRGNTLHPARNGELSVDFSNTADGILSFDTNDLAQNVTCYWKNTRSSSATIISFSSASSRKFDFGNDLDAMLINQANCVTASSGTKIIKVWGNRTSASDTAVATLKSNGYTVTINDIEL